MAGGVADSWLLACTNAHVADSAALGMADVTGILEVYSRGGKASPACRINQAHGFAEAKKDNLTLTLRCHEDTEWPYHHELLNY